MKRFTLFLRILALVMLMSLLPVSVGFAELDTAQSNAIAMLNYITVLTQDINASSNSRLYLEEAYTSLINNTYPNAVDETTLAQLNTVLDTMEDYRMLSIARDRLQYTYEQQLAQSIRALMPDPISSLGVSSAASKAQMAIAIAGAASQSIVNFYDAREAAETQFLQSSQTLDDEEAEVLHKIRKDTFTYMVSIVNQYDLPGDLTLTEASVDEFVEWKNNDNVISRIQFLESNRSTYQSYGGYWLLLAQSYYDNGDYEKCLDAIEAYEELNCRIFRKDYDLAKTLPCAISAAEQIYDDADYEAYAARYAQRILGNVDNDDWALRYYAAMVYVDLAELSGDEAYLNTAYTIVLNNVNYLSGEQRDLNDTYLAPVQKTSVSKGATKSEKKEIEQANKALTSIRKTELPPISEPLRLNCELLAALADQANISDSERQKIDGILHPNGEALFLVPAVDALYWFADAPAETDDDIGIEFGGTSITLPAECCTVNAQITVSVSEEDATEPVVLSDWQLDSVKRVTEGDISTYRAVYTSAAAKEHDWQSNATIHIDVVPMAGTDTSAYAFDFTTRDTKDKWYDYLKVWEGHKNNWYDYAKVWENSVEFVQVK